MDSVPSMVAGRYRVVRELGRGGMGQLYVVEHVHTGEQLALKVLGFDGRADAASIERFKREARASAKIRSEHVVRVIDADVAPELGDRPFLVMELLDGSDLEQHVGSRPQTPPTVLGWLRQIAPALDKAHRLGIVHRDLKPENLFLTRNEQGGELVKILDFGIAKLTAESGNATQTGTMLGTPRYMAPEQAHGQLDQIGPACDVWAIGLITYRLLSGRSYWAAESAALLIAQIVYERMRPPSELGLDLSADFDAWFLRSCARVPADRWASIGEQIAALAACLPADATVWAGSDRDSSSLGFQSTLAVRPPSTPAAHAEQPSIAVLPFANLSDDRDQEYFSDGITEDIITDLSKVGGLLVIARNSSFAYKGKAADVRQIARELGVGSILEGSVRRAGNRVRISAQLIDASSGAHLWAERYDRDLSDVFVVQDEVTRQIVDALKVKLTPDESALLAPAAPVDRKAHDAFLLGRALLFGPIKNREIFERVTDLFQQAIAADPGYGEPLAGLAQAHILDYQNQWTDDHATALDKAEAYLATALEKSPNVAFVHYVASVLAMQQKDLERLAAEADAALAINPNYALAQSARGWFYTFSGEPLAGVPHFERAIRLDPLYRQQYVHFLGTAYLVAGEYEKAAALFEERLRLVPNTDLSRAFLASALGHLGKTAEAQRVWQELTAINPKYSFVEHVGRLPFRHALDIERIAEGLRKAGLNAG